MVGQRQISQIIESSLLHGLPAAALEQNRRVCGCMESQRIELWSIASAGDYLASLPLILINIEAEKLHRAIISVEALFL